MIIKEVLHSLKETKLHPVARVLYKTAHCKVLVIGFKKGMKLKEHKTEAGGKLTVLEGAVIYKQEAIVKQLDKYDEIDIPQHIPHSVTAIEDSLCLLVL